MLVTPDFSDVQDSVGTGTYFCRIVDAQMGEWQKKDGSGSTPYINWRMETFNEENPKNNGRSVFHKTPLTGGGAFRLKDFYKAATKSQLAGPFETEELLGKEVLITLVDGTDRDGNPTGFTDVKTVRPV